VTVALERRYHVPRSQVWEGSRGGQSGKVHLHVLDELHVGRLHRRRGAALCGRSGWYERPPEYESERADEALCPLCVGMANRHELAIPAAAE
jgi:hypothetical protein